MRHQNVLTDIVQILYHSKNGNPEDLTLKHCYINLELHQTVRILLMNTIYCVKCENLEDATLKHS